MKQSKLPVDPYIVEVDQVEVVHSVHIGPAFQYPLAGLDGKMLRA